MPPSDRSGYFQATSVFINWKIKSVQNRIYLHFPDVGTTVYTNSGSLPGFSVIFHSLKPPGPDAALALLHLI